MLFRENSHPAKAALFVSADRREAPDNAYGAGQRGTPRLGAFRSARRGGIYLAMLSSNRLNFRSCACAVVLAGLGACASGDVDQPIATPPTALLSFEGVVENGEVRLWAVGQGPGSTSLEQELTAVVEDRNGVRGAAATTESIEMTVQRVAPYTPPTVVPGGCGSSESFDITVGVRNFHLTRLSNVHLEITSINDRVGNPTPGLGDHSLCNSEIVAPNLLVDNGAGTVPLSNALGLIRYGNLEPDPDGGATVPSSEPVPEPLGSDATAHAMVWRFRNGGGSFGFAGRVVADVCGPGDCTPGAITGHSAAIAPNNPRAWDTNGSVLAVAEGQGVAYIGGSFTRVGPRTGSAFAAAADMSSLGAALSSFPAFEGGNVNTMVPDGAGGAWVGGSFTSAANQQGRLVHILAGGAVDPGFSPPSSVVGAGSVLSMDFDTTNGNLWIGLAQAPFLVVIDGDTGAETLLPPRPDRDIRRVVVAGSRVLISGSFTKYGADANRRNRAGIAILTAATGAIDTSFAVPVGGVVDAFVTDGTTIWIGGSFTTVGGVGRPRLAALGITTNSLLPWNPVADGAVSALALGSQGGTPVVAVGGSFLTVRGVGRSRLAAVDADPAVASPNLRAWAPVANKAVTAIALDGTDALVGGVFTTINGISRRFLAAVSGNMDIASGAAEVRVFDPSPDAFVRVIAEDPANSRILIGGDFRGAGGTPRNRIAAIRLSTGELESTFDASIGDGVVRSLLLADGRVWVGGTFTSVSGSARSRLAALNPTTGVLDPINVVVSGAVLALAADQSNLYLGGDFSVVGARTQRRLARMTFAGTVDSGWAPVLNGQVNALAVDNGGVFAGGVFTTPASRVGRLNLTNGGVLADYGANGEVNALGLRHERLYVGGLFTAIGGGARTNLGAISTLTDTLDPTFAPSPPDLAVRAISVAGNTVVVGGDFQTPRNRLVSFDNVSGATQAFAPLPLNQGTSINAVATIGRFVIAGGALVASPGGTEVNTAGTTSARALRTSLVMVHSE
jgi:hypothetical protein